MQEPEGASDRFTAAAGRDSDVTAVRFVDRPRAEMLARLGIQSVDDLLRHYPFRYLDLSSTVTLARVRPDTEATVVGIVHEVKVKKPRPRLNITEVALTDGTGTLIGVWFNQPYVQQRFRVGERVAFAGRVQLDFGLKQIRNPFFEKLAEDADPAALARIVPVHRATEGLSTNWIRRLVTEALAQFGGVPDPLPAVIRRSRRLMPLAEALREIHFPESMESGAEARRRLAYEEFLMVRLGMSMRRHDLVDVLEGTPHRVDGPAVRAFREALPFRLTADQDAAVEGILADMALPKPMNRMLLGDVGSGKTVVAGFALAAAADSGKQAAMMAPTEVLARQYALKLAPMLEEAGVRTAVLTGSTPAAEARQIKDSLASGETQVAFGTHALLEEGVVFAGLSLAVVDEQHRFGVNQRLGLRAKGRGADMLVMTATPIPRSLALTLYGDLDSSVVRERPHGRSPAEHITTRIVPPSGREDAYAAVRAAVRDGGQAYVVCAMVDESDAAQAKAAVKEAERLRERVFPKLRVGLLTGKMRPVDKAKVMESFRAKEIDVLVATTVIEVGIDVANATVMIVEDAERFGLSQLHQLRGRVGRGEAPGQFLLFSDARTDEGRRRMEIISTVSDGFDLAEEDLRLRGEGQVLGERQSGMPELLLADLAADGDLLEAAREDATVLTADDPGMTSPANAPLAESVRRAFGKQWEWVSSG